MSDKSFVTLEQHSCPVCGLVFDTGALLLDRRMRDTFERTTVTEFGLCPEHAKMNDEGWLALVEIQPGRSTPPYKPDNVYRTGRIAHLKRSRVPDVFVGENIPDDLPLVYIEPGVLERMGAVKPDEGQGAA